MNTLFAHFWRAQPALFVGLHLLVGAACGLKFEGAFLIPLLFLWTPLLFGPKPFTKLLVCAALLLSGWAHAHFRGQTPHLVKPVAGLAYVQISSVKKQSSPFMRSTLYKGTVKQFQTKEGEKLENLPFWIALPLYGKHPPAHCDYIIEGSLVEKHPGRFHLKPLKGKPWKPIEKTFSLAEARYRAKEGVRSYLKKVIPHPQSSNFLTALVTGEIEERSLSYDFGRLGMQHILAISGFHFALLAAFCSFWLRLFLSQKKAAAILLILLTLYFLFVGGAASVQRAWIAIFVLLTSHLFNLRTTALNALGIALIIEILVDPLALLQIGFQLSFLATIAILLLTRPLDGLITSLLPERTLRVASKMDSLNQHGAILSALIRKTLAVSGAVHLVTLPALLFLFHKFPLLSLVYNLFFPFWVSLSLLLLLLSLFLTLLFPPLGLLLHSCNSAFTAALLHLTSHPPLFLDYSLRINTLPLSFVIAFISLCLFGGIWWKARSEIF